MGRKKNIVTAVIAILCVICGCDSIDCSLYNSVSYTTVFYANGKAVTINDTLTITACGTDSVLLNKKAGAGSVKLPMSFWNAEDTLVFTVCNKDYIMHDTVWIAKQNTPHYESPDCPTNMFHEIIGVRCTHTFIDSISILQPSVNYAETQNLSIHLISGE